MKSFISIFMMFFAATAIGAEINNVYVHGFAGPQYIHVTGCWRSAVGTLPGYVIGGGIGCKFDVFRGELELAYRHNKFQENVPLAPDVFFDEGEVEKISAVANIYYDCPYHLYIPYLKPFIGIGVGVRKNMERAELLTFENYEIWLEEFRYDKVSLACQGIIGFGMPFSRHTCTKVEYRLFKDTERMYNHSFVVDLSRSF